ncbi:MAG: TRAP transporter large permease [Rhodospirillales bacterium]
MTPVAIGFLSIGCVLALIALRIPIGVVLGTVALVGIAHLRGLDVALGVLKSTPFEFSAKWSLTAIPMFLLMGAIAYHAGIGSALFNAARAWFGRLPGGLAVATNFACAGFAAASGSSLATAAAMGRLAIPDMLKSGYDKGLATGVVASAGTLGSLIPPSILFVLYGVFAEVSIVKLFIAGVLPGILTAVVYATMLIIRCRLRPELAPTAAVAASWAEKWRVLAEIWPIVALIVGVIGSLYSGVVTPTEAGAFGALLAAVIAFVQGRLNWRVMRDSVVEATETTASIFFVAVGAVLYTKFLALTGMPRFMGGMIGSWALDPLLLVLATAIIYVIFGCFLDPLGLMLITLPILLPMYKALGVDLIWFGVLVIKFLEIGLLTPPVGFNVYVIKSVVGDAVPLETIFKGVAWFLVCEVVVVTLLVVFPAISLYLPGTLD